MRYIRIFIAMVCCICFASASFASTQMTCCMEQAKAQPMAEQDMQHAAMPCHEADVPSKSESQDAPKLGCKCVCTLHTVQMPETHLPERMAKQAGATGVQPLPPLGFHPPIDAPPRAFS